MHKKLIKLVIRSDFGRVKIHKLTFKVIEESDLSMSYCRLDQKEDLFNMSIAKKDLLKVLDGNARFDHKSYAFNLYCSEEDLEDAKRILSLHTETYLRKIKAEFEVTEEAFKNTLSNFEFEEYNV
jgi:hypothetical protein